MKPSVLSFSCLMVTEDINCFICFQGHLCIARSSPHSTCEQYWGSSASRQHRIQLKYSILELASVDYSWQQLSQISFSWKQISFSQKQTLTCKFVHGKLIVQYSQESHLRENKGSRIEQRRKPNCKALGAEVSAKPTDTRARMDLWGNPDLRKGKQSLCPWLTSTCSKKSLRQRPTPSEELRYEFSVANMPSSWVNECLLKSGSFLPDL